jgi:hypothetical protein
MKVAMRTMKLGLVDKFVKVAPVAFPRHLRVCGCKKSTEGVKLYIIIITASISHTNSNSYVATENHIKKIIRLK